MSEKYILTVCSLGDNPNLEKCISKLLKIKSNSAFPIEVLLIINKAKSEKNYSSDLIVHYEPSKGYSNVRNKALSVIPENSNIIFIDDDELASESWLKALIKMHQSHPYDLIFGPVLPAPGLNDCSYREQFRKYFEQLPDGSTVRRAGSGNLLIPRNLINRGLIHFDPIFNLTGSEDTDLCFRLTKNGVKIRYAKEAVLYELETFQKFDKDYLADRYVREVSNYSVIIRKNSSTHQKIWRLTTLIVRTLVYSCLALLNDSYTLKKRAYASGLRAFISSSLVI
jgi:GT2 family glycosyltransferase